LADAADFFGVHLRQSTAAGAVIDRGFGGCGGFTRIISEFHPRESAKSAVYSSPPVEIGAGATVNRRAGCYTGRRCYETSRSSSRFVILSAAKNLVPHLQPDSSLRSLETPLKRRCFTAFSMTRASFYAGADAAWGIDNSE
jgi:hypothetical protein